MRYNALSEMGESRGKSKLRDIEASLSMVGQVVYNLAKDHYKFAKHLELYNQIMILLSFQLI